MSKEDQTEEGPTFEPKVIFYFVEDFEEAVKQIESVQSTVEKGDYIEVTGSGIDQGWKIWRTKTGTLCVEETGAYFE